MSDLPRRQRISIGIAELAVALAVVIMAFAVTQSAIEHRAAAEAERERQIADTKRFTAIVAACLNGRAITDGERIVDCKERK